jgi:hypothetical protein
MFGQFSHDKTINKTLALISIYQLGCATTWDSSDLLQLCFERGLETLGLLY